MNRQIDRERVISIQMTHFLKQAYRLADRLMETTKQPFLIAFIDEQSDKETDRQKRYKVDTHSNRQMSEQTDHSDKQKPVNIKISIQSQMTFSGFKYF